MNETKAPAINTRNDTVKVLALSARNILREVPRCTPEKKIKQKGNETKELLVK